MSKYFVTGDGESTKDIFRKKQVYKIVARSNMPNLVDFNFAEKALYGRVNRYYQPMVANENRLVMTELSSGGVSSVKAFNFVVDAFKDLQNKFIIKTANNEIDTEDEFLATLKPVAGYVDPKILYRNYKLAYVTGMGKIIDNKRIKFADFDEFTNTMIPYIMNTLKTKTFTFQAFMKSKECPINASGLVIEIGAKIKSNDDDFKYEKFYKSQNWDFFLNACNTYGFMVDCNMPNRLVADIASPVMIEKMLQYDPGLTSTDAFLLGCYDTTSVADFSDFKRFLYDIYNENKKRNIIVTTTINSDNTRYETRKVKTYSYQNFLKDYDDEYFFKLYSKIRFMEEESQFTESEKGTITQNILELMKIDRSSALEVFEIILNKTFDYNGSLSYIINRQNLLRR